MGVEIVPVLLFPPGPPVFVDEMIFGQGGQPRRKIPAALVFREGMEQLDEDFLGEILGFLVRPGKLVGQVEHFFREKINQHFPVSFVAVPATLYDRVQIHSLHLYKRIPEERSSVPEARFSRDAEGAGDIEKTIMAAVIVIEL